MPYNKKDFKESNINYINKDFLTIKKSLIEYSKSYFPNTYKDFNESSPGMMLMEMSAYVGDVLSFYIDQQYREMLLPLAEEKRNVINIANMLGYKTKPKTPAHVTLTFTQEVGVEGDVAGSNPKYSEASIINKGQKVAAASNSDIVFETLDIVDFTTSGSYNGDTERPTQSSRNANDLVDKWKLKRNVRAISGETKTKTFTVGTPTKFLEVNISDKNVIEIIDIIDTNGNKWYEVDYLAQDKVPMTIHFTSDARTDANHNLSEDNLTAVNGEFIPVPYSLSFIKTSKRFITKVRDDDTTSLVFGNGIIRTGTTLDESFIETDQIGINIPGQSQHMIQSVDPLIGDEFSTLGEAPAHTVLVVRYRVGGGINANVTAGDLTEKGTLSLLVSGGGTITVTNNEPARGGSAQQSSDEIRERAAGFFGTQNRCVTKDDYEARTLALPAKFGNIAKAYVRRTPANELFSQLATFGEWQCDSTGVVFPGTEEACSSNPADYDTNNYIVDPHAQCPYCNDSCDDACDQFTDNLHEQLISLGEFYRQYGDDSVPTIDIWTLSYNSNKDLVQLSDGHLLKKNLKNYISNFRLISDSVQIRNGFIINFGVYFDVVSHLHAIKSEIKLKCIKKIIDYFDTSKMQFMQPIYVSQIEYELMNIDGVRAVNEVRITQGTDDDITNYLELFGKKLYTLSWDVNNEKYTEGDTGTGPGYGYMYDFEYALDNGIVRPSVDPAVFELKNPKKNVVGVVR